MIGRRTGAGTTGGIVTTSTEAQTSTRFTEHTTTYEFAMWLEIRPVLFPSTKQGSGTFTLSGANTYTGTTNLNAGTLKLQGGAAIADTDAVVLANTDRKSTRLNSSHMSISYAVFCWKNKSIVTNSTAATTSTLTTCDAIRPPPASTLFPYTTLFRSTKQGSGTFTLSGANTYTGTTNLNAGTLKLQGGAAIADTDAVVLANTDRKSVV